MDKMASISILTSFGNLDTSIVERAGKGSENLCFMRLFTASKLERSVKKILSFNMLSKFPPASLQIASQLSMT